MSKKIGIVFVLALVTIFSSFSAFGQGGTTILEKWGFGSLLRANGEIRWSKEGVITIPSGSIAVDFLFRNPPIIRPSKAQNQFDFDSPPPKGGAGVKIAFTTSKIENGEAQVPMFAPVSAKSVNEFNGVKFADYTDTYAFTIKLSNQGGGVSVVDLNCFREGAVHHIFGDVKLFGAKFSNNSKDPFVFKIQSGKYVWVSGSGTVTTKDGASTNIGIP